AQIPRPENLCPPQPSPGASGGCSSPEERRWPLSDGCAATGPPRPGSCPGPESPGLPAAAAGGAGRRCPSGPSSGADAPDNV
ncbi:DNA-binding protein, partial [Dysosmobacter welbionis]